MTRTMRQVVLVGERPSPRSRPPHTPLTGAVGKRIMRLCGICRNEGEPTVDEWVQYARWFRHRYNLFKDPGSSWDADEAHYNAHYLMKSLEYGTQQYLVVMLGRRVQKAFDASGKFYQEARNSSGKNVYVCVPHPSGRSRYWNSPVNVKEAQAFWRNLIR